MNHSQKIITKCDGIITKCDGQLLQIATALLLQSATRFITNCDRYYKVRWLLQIATVQTRPGGIIVKYPLNYNVLIGSHRGLSCLITGLYSIKLNFGVVQLTPWIKVV